MLYIKSLGTVVLKRANVPQEDKDFEDSYRINRTFVAEFGLYRSVEGRRTVVSTPITSYSKSALLRSIQVGINGVWGTSGAETRSNGSQNGMWILGERACHQELGSVERSFRNTYPLEDDISVDSNSNRVIPSSNPSLQSSCMV